MDFPQYVTFFCECNSVRVGQNIQNEVSLERSIFAADVVAYQFINFNWKLNVSREECIPRSIWSYTTLAVRKGLSIITSKLYCMRNQMRFDGRRLCKASINIATRCSCFWSSQVGQTELLSSSHAYVWRIGEIREHQLCRKRVITRNPKRILLPLFLEERCWRENYIIIIISRLSYYNLYIFFTVSAATPKGPKAVMAFHITIRMDQFYCCQCATIRDNKTAV